MIKIDFDPVNLVGIDLQEWQEWEAKALIATQEIMQEYDIWENMPSPKPKLALKFKDTIWKDLKNWLLKKVFNRKCAYCESELVRASFDAEHFRPKAKVDYKNSGQRHIAKALDSSKTPIDHPGYFWLAYNWRNLVPSCEYCNSGSGKQNQFPVKKQYIFVHHPTSGSPQKYLNPTTLDDLEDPLLLNPYEDNPREHLIFDDHGIVVPRNNSEKGQHSIEVFRLDEDNLVRARDKQQQDVYDDYLLAFRYYKRIQGLNDTQSKTEAYQDIKNSISKKIYSAAALDYVEKHI